MALLYAPLPLSHWKQLPSSILIHVRKEEAFSLNRGLVPLQSYYRGLEITLGGAKIGDW